MLDKPCLWYWRQTSSIVSHDGSKCSDGGFNTGLLIEKLPIDSLIFFLPGVICPSTLHSFTRYLNLSFLFMEHACVKDSCAVVYPQVMGLTGTSFNSTSFPALVAEESLILLLTSVRKGHLCPPVYLPVLWLYVHGHVWVLQDGIWAVSYSDEARLHQEVPTLQSLGDDVTFLARKCLPKPGAPGPWFPPCGA